MPSTRTLSTIAGTARLLAGGCRDRTEPARPGNDPTGVDALVIDEVAAPSQS